MSGRVLLWLSVAVLLAGVAIVTLAPSVSAETGPGDGIAWLIPVGYFTTLLGAVGLCIGWFRKQR